ncbi:unnamed protein product [Didymodactylos carnosus]|uniref:Peptidase S1 domain-containing protein n=1 Tax=Didymodactylos carnosus TaxID=1234261 RepID=A0A8S2FCB2_9BILA|nr:unnamed protein product [Didymodactylos carnosus]CAF4220950.1 unnamed protein product [Didymodactylos carnosus]
MLVSANLNNAIPGNGRQYLNTKKEVINDPSSALLSLIAVAIGIFLILLSMSLGLGLGIGLTPYGKKNATLIPVTITTTPIQTKVIVRLVPKLLQNINCNLYSPCGCQTTGVDPVFRNMTFTTTGGRRRRHKRVVGGTKVTDSRLWPWLVRIGTKTVFYCHGMLVNSTSRVYATVSCLRHHSLTVPELYVDYQLTSALYYTGRLKVLRVIQHPDYISYGNGLHINDLALLVLNASVPNSTPICLPSIESIFYPPDNTVAVLIGYGGSSQLNQVILRTLEPDTNPLCSQFVSSSYSGELFCAGFTAGLQDACFDDLSAPLLQYDIVNRRWILIGLVSNVTGCGMANMPSVYTRVAAYVDWNPLLRK